jgi:hypothetical protein
MAARFRARLFPRRPDVDRTSALGRKQKFKQKHYRVPGPMEIWGNLPQKYLEAQGVLNNNVTCYAVRRQVIRRTEAVIPPNIVATYRGPYDRVRYRTLPGAHVRKKLDANENSRLSR